MRPQCAIDQGLHKLRFAQWLYACNALHSSCLVLVFALQLIAALTVEDIPPAAHAQQRQPAVLQN